MNKILNFKKKYLNKSTIDHQSQSNVNNNPSKPTLNKDLDKDNKNEKDDKKTTSKKVNKTTTTTYTPYNKNNNNSTINISGSKTINGSNIVIGAPLHGLFSKGKKSNEISNNNNHRKIIQPFSEVDFLKQKHIQSQPPLVQPPQSKQQTNNDDHNNGNSVNINGNKSFDMFNQRSIDFYNKKKIQTNIDKLIESSKDEYVLKVKEIENKVLINSKPSNNKDPTYQTMKKIIEIEKQMISVFDIMINDQINHKTTFKNIVSTSKKLNNHHFFNTK